MLAFATPAGAITGGQPDGNAHPYSALILVPGVTFCSGTLIDEDVVLTAGHCTDFWSDRTDDIDIREVRVTFDSQAAVDPETWLPTGGTWYRTNRWVTHPDYDGDEWPFTADYGLVLLEAARDRHIGRAARARRRRRPDRGLAGQTEVRFV